MFQHTAARRRLLHIFIILRDITGFNTQPPEGGCAPNGIVELLLGVSTHSRPKAAVPPVFHNRQSPSFNTQPPEGGCPYSLAVILILAVSTHSRPKAADFQSLASFRYSAFQHTAARRRLLPKR